MKSVKEKLKEIREHFNLSQEEVGKRMNRSQSAYGKLETGITNIGIFDLEAFSKAVGLSMIDVLTWPEKWVPEQQIQEYRNNVELQHVEENYSRCKICEEKQERIIELKDRVSDLKNYIKLLESLQASNQRTSSG